MDLLKATGMVISSNVTLGASSPKDRGVCVYFNLKGKPYALPCDKWDCPEDNLWALAKHIENMRAQERWGVGSIERVFAGYQALMGPAGTNPEEWWSVLRIERTASFDQAQEAYRNEARRCHPDNGGSNEKMAVLNAAWAAAKLAYGK
ncbi:MAG TPA: J domain-containing protein [Salinarimonas sp.]|nr:J domain-containing protein [Salinarimonas sp.]